MPALITAGRCGGRTLHPSGLPPAPPLRRRHAVMPGDQRREGQPVAVKQHTGLPHARHPHACHAGVGVAASAWATASAADSTRANASISVPLAVNDHVVAARPCPISRPASSRTTALLEVVPTSTPTSTCDTTLLQLTAHYKPAHLRSIEHRAACGPRLSVKTAGRAPPRSAGFGASGRRGREGRGDALSQSRS